MAEKRWGRDNPELWTQVLHELRLKLGFRVGPISGGSKGGIKLGGLKDPYYRF